MRSKQELAQKARELLVLANRQRDPEVKRRLLLRARQVRALVRFARLAEQGKSTHPPS
jgi:hypothetical protein